MMESYKDYLPKRQEKNRVYARRLEEAGAEEVLIRKALADHFEMPVEEMGTFFEDYPDARLRHIALLKHIHPGRTRYSLIKKLSKNLGISEEGAELWIDRFDLAEKSGTTTLSETSDDRRKDI